MDGRNCSGRRISLLNDSSDHDSAAHTNHPSSSAKFPLPAHSHSQASSSCASTPSLSPQTPLLVRCASSDSRALFGSPSPLTPSSNIPDSGSAPPAKHAHHQQYYLHNPSGAKMDDQNASMYPPIPDATGVMPSAYPMPPQQMQPQQLQPQMQVQPNQQVYRASNSPASEPSRVSTVSATSNPKAQSKKNQYPCPMAKQVGCTDYFTTSGHAARHAKKHTGKKDAFCPECNKAFTRKDNMEQHRRTHQNGRGASRSSNGNGNGDESKVKKATKPPAKKPTADLKPQQFEAAVEQQLADQPQPVQAPLQAQAAQAAQAQAQQQQAQQQVQQQQQALEQAMMMQPGGPYFMNATDSGPIPPLPNVMPDLNMRPPLHRTNFTSGLDYVPQMAPMGPVNDPDSLHYSYPSPGLSNGLNSLALAASEHRRWSEEKAQSQSPQHTPSEET